jgi:hypothetical protein
MLPQCWRKIKFLIRVKEATKLYYKAYFAKIMGKPSHTASSVWLTAKQGHLILVVTEISLMKFVQIPVCSEHKR